MYEIFNRNRPAPLETRKGSYYKHRNEGYYFLVLGFVEDYYSIEVRTSTNPGERAYLRAKDRNYEPATEDDWRLACAKTSAERTIEQCFRILHENQEGKLIKNTKFVERLRTNTTNLMDILDKKRIEVHPDSTEPPLPEVDCLFITESTALLAHPD